MFLSVKPCSRKHYLKFYGKLHAQEQDSQSLKSQHKSYDEETKNNAKDISDDILAMRLYHFEGSNVPKAKMLNMDA